jgi:hypothetical protein
MSHRYEPPNLSALSENDQIQEVYAAAGLALYMAQVVEYGLINLLLVSRLADPSLQTEFRSADEFFEAHFRQVMGRLVKAVQLHVDTSADLDARLDDVLRLRNFIAHGFFRDRAELFMHEEGRRLMLDELAASIYRFEAVDAELRDLLLSIGAHFGMSREKLEATLEAMIAAARPSP